MALVIDNGTGSLKAGFAGDEAPRMIEPTLVGRPQSIQELANATQRYVYCGLEVEQQVGTLELSRPVVRGMVEDWEDMQVMWHHVFFDRLKINPQEHALLISDAPGAASKDREQMAEIFFEDFGFKSLFVQNTAVLSLFASGRTTGVLIDVGHGLTSAVPVFEGYALGHSFESVQFAGEDLTSLLFTELEEQGLLFGTSREQFTIQELKEQICRVRVEEEGGSHDFELPDGQLITVLAKALESPSALFEREQPLQELILTAISKSDNGIRTTLCRNAVLSGGSSLFSGFAERLQRELDFLSARAGTHKVELEAPVDRKFAAFLGASVFAHLPAFGKVAAALADYQELGAACVSLRFL